MNNLIVRFSVPVPAHPVELNRMLEDEWEETMSGMSGTGEADIFRAYQKQGFILNCSHLAHAGQN